MRPTYDVASFGMSASGVAFVITASVSTIARLRFETCGDELSQCVYARQKLQLQRREVFKAAGGASARRAVNNVSVNAAEYLVIWRSVEEGIGQGFVGRGLRCLLYTSPSPRDRTRSRMPSSA